MKIHFYFLVCHFLLLKLLLSLLLVFLLFFGYILCMCTRFQCAYLLCVLFIIVFTLLFDIGEESGGTVNCTLGVCFEISLSFSHTHPLCLLLCAQTKEKKQQQQQTATAAQTN